MIFNNYCDWLAYRSQVLSNYNQPSNHWRFDLELSGPYDTLTKVPVDYNPHYGPYFAHDCFYISYNWSSIWGVHQIQTPEYTRFRLLVECDHKNPWGEQIGLYSTSSEIVDPPWQNNKVQKFAHFRDKFWKITFNEFLHPFPAGIADNNLSQNKTCKTWYKLFQYPQLQYQFYNLNLNDITFESDTIKDYDPLNFEIDEYRQDAF